MRKRVVIGAYACGPVPEPEARAGWEIALAATRDHDVHVVTRHRFREFIEPRRESDPLLAQRLKVSYVDLAPGLVRLKRRSWDLYWYYVLWQRALARTVHRLHVDNPFDLAHHVTFANDWLPCGLTVLRDIPLVWGPVGGASHLPVWRLARWLGVRGTLTELVRGAVTTAARPFGGHRVGRQASLIVAQNADVMRHFSRFGNPVIVEPNACLDDLPMRRPVQHRRAVFAGRLLPLKGAILAIEAVARTPDWTLRIYGSGSEERRLRRAAGVLGVANRIEFMGHRPRDEVLEALATAEVFLFPSMHDQAGWVVAEASSIGCPIVCLPLGGPPVLAEPNGHIASLEGDIVGNVVQQMEVAARSQAVPTSRWSTSRLPDVVADWYVRALS